MHAQSSNEPRKFKEVSTRILMAIVVCDRKGRLMVEWWTTITSKYNVKH
jgi:hypothetical protein